MTLQGYLTVIQHLRGAPKAQIIFILMHGVQMLSGLVFLLDSLFAALSSDSMDILVVNLCRMKTRGCDELVMNSLASNL